MGWRDINGSQRNSHLAQVQIISLSRKNLQSYYPPWMELAFTVTIKLNELTLANDFSQLNHPEENLEYLDVRICRLLWLFRFVHNNILFQFSKQTLKNPLSLISAAGLNPQRSFRDTLRFARMKFVFSSLSRRRRRCTNRKKLGLKSWNSFPVRLLLLLLKTLIEAQRGFFWTVRVMKSH